MGQILYFYKTIVIFKLLLLLKSAGVIKTASHLNYNISECGQYSGPDGSEQQQRKKNTNK